MSDAPSIQPFGALPSARQLDWHALETYGFIHFTTNTFTDLEWGYGDESPAVFQPVALDARQWVRAAKAGGLRGLILTCKHHDGFCLWPSQFTEHSVKHSPWRNGAGDVVAELSTACREDGLKFGVYLSPWDRHRADYGSDSYVQYYRDQLRELLTRYGEIFEVWHDGANGGDGWYGGARQHRTIDASCYYGWEQTWSLARSLQPQAVIFSDVGPDVRWVGNEDGIGTETTWCTLNVEGRYPGDGKIADQGSGHENGSRWIAPESDVSIRPGWFYHTAEDNRVKTPAELLDIYFWSVGRGTSLLLNLPPDRRGLIHETDVAHLRQFRERLNSIFSDDLAKQAVLTASSTLSDQHSAACLTDDDPLTCWAAASPNAVIELEFPRPLAFNVLSLQESIAYGQRVRGWTLEALDGSQHWQTVCSGTTIGCKRLKRFPVCVAQKLRLRLLDNLAPPVLTSLSLYDGGSLVGL